ncbi:MAG: hypothetical protein Q8W44_13670 [Candidatus Palauibacterales bacterium]|nr:hypothetical protein [Candidatus Palauibacterales bacterium]
MSSSVTCHLARGDGSRWIVTSYRRGPDGVTVSAVRELDADAADDAGAVTGDGGPPALRRARLAEDDRLEWRGADGRILASSAPVPGENPGS